MWWLRRRRGMLSAPPLAASDLRHLPWCLWPLAAGMGWALPVFGASLLALAALEGMRLLLQRPTVDRVAPRPGC